MTRKVALITDITGQGWSHTVGFGPLVREMVAADFAGIEKRNDMHG